MLATATVDASTSMLVTGVQRRCFRRSMLAPATVDAPLFNVLPSMLAAVQLFKR